MKRRSFLKGMVAIPIAVKLVEVYPKAAFVVGQDRQPTFIHDNNYITTNYPLGRLKFPPPLDPEVPMELWFDVKRGSAQFAGVGFGEECHLDYLPLPTYPFQIRISGAIPGSAFVFQTISYAPLADNSVGIVLGDEITLNTGSV